VNEIRGTPRGWTLASYRPAGPCPAETRCMDGGRPCRERYDDICAGGPHRLPARWAHEEI